MTDRPEVTVIVPSQTPGAQLVACLASMAFQHTTRSYEIVVVHSGHDLSGSDVLRLPRVSVVEVDDALLPAAKKNLAARQARSEWLLFLDSDCIASPDLLETLVTTAISNDAVGVGASIDIGPPINAVTWPTHMLEYGRWLPAARSGACRDFATCGAVYRRQAFLDVGGFPEDIFPCCDTTLNAKLRARGAKLWFTSRTFVIHQQMDERERLLRKSARYGRAYAVVAARYGLPGHRLRGRASIPPIVAGRLGRMVIRALLYRPLTELRYLLTSAPMAVRSTLIWANGVATGPVPVAESLDTRASTGPDVPADRRTGSGIRT